LLEDNGHVIEQYLFTQITIGKPIPEKALEPENRGKDLVWHRAEEPSADVSSGSWEARQLPPGFVLTARMMRNLPAHRQPVEHLVYSDGLAVISVFVEPTESASRSTALSGMTHMGAVHAYGKIEDDHQITVVGEAPAATVDMIGASVSRLPPSP
jgi:sigma-E factor negative regulatory protein RseB